MKNENRIKAETAIKNAKEILAANKINVVEMDRVMTDGRNQYTRNVGGSFSARTEAEYMLMEVFGDLDIKDSETEEWMQAEAAKLGITLE